MNSPTPLPGDLNRSGGAETQNTTGLSTDDLDATATSSPLVGGLGNSQRDDSDSPVDSDAKIAPESGNGMRAESEK